MYKKAMCILSLGSIMLLACCICVKGIDAARLYNEPVEMLRLELAQLEQKAREMEDVNKGLGIAEVAVSGQRVLGYSVLEKTYAYSLSDEDLEVLLRIVEAEAGCEDEEGKLLVANVVLNRVNNPSFPDTVTDVVFQRENGVTQFSPVSDGRYYQVKISEETIRAVGRALLGEDISQGALYFAAREYADEDRMLWFDNNLTHLFVHGGHEFFR